MRELLSHSFATVRSGRLLSAHLLLNAVVVVCASLWLLIPDERAWQLVASASAALALSGIVLWLHSSTFAYAVDPQPERLCRALRPSLRGFVWVLLGAAVLIWCMNVVDGWAESQAQLSVYLYSKTPTFLRPTSGEFAFYNATGRAFSIVYWYLLPALLLPSITEKVTGSQRFSGLRTLMCWRYWLAMAAIVAVGVYLTGLLIGWRPGYTLRAQSISLVVRLAIAYILATLSWLTMIGVLGHFVRPKDTAAVRPEQKVV